MKYMYPRWGYSFDGGISFDVDDRMIAEIKTPQKSFGHLGKIEQ